MSLLFGWLTFYIMVINHDIGGHIPKSTDYDNFSKYYMAVYA